MRSILQTLSGMKRISKTTKRILAYCGVINQRKEQNFEPQPMLTKHKGLVIRTKMMMRSLSFFVLLLSHPTTLTLAFLDYPSPPTTFKAQAPSPKAALVFMHGLGNSPKTCIPLIQDKLTKLDPTLCQNIKFVFPSAPRRCITINGGRCLPSWFDLYDWPVKVSVRDDVNGIRQAVQQIQQQVAQLESEGVPKSRIVLGGFSQGAALALENAYGSSTDESFAGCIALSGWLALRDNLYCKPKTCKTPLFWGHGRFDDSVRPEQQFFGVKKLLEQGVQSTTSKSYDMGHGVSTEELRDVANFLRKILSLSEEDQAAKESEAATAVVAVVA
jgi:predicted esterase